MTVDGSNSTEVIDDLVREISDNVDASADELRAADVSFPPPWEADSVTILDDADE